MKIKVGMTVENTSEQNTNSGGIQQLIELAEAVQHSNNEGTIKLLIPGNLNGKSMNIDFNMNTRIQVVIDRRLDPSAFKVGTEILTRMGLSC
ncbi:hypothetical protein GNF10_36135 [Nostoc sp. UCD121]|jgi:hypothetical protein|uniref:hypothetical protein n=1 Tax=Nostoc sp. UCD121 TaxID=2681305 RepID=UPI00162581E2|nr:hypothetical protein [Nostoc sp. UCD121]MBC1281209.1 hypothetical protein [Nostoc sp. UCD121]